MYGKTLEHINFTFHQDKWQFTNSLKIHIVILPFNKFDGFL